MRKSREMIPILAVLVAFVLCFTACGKEAEHVTKDNNNKVTLGDGVADATAQAPVSDNDSAATTVPPTYTMAPAETMAEAITITVDVVDADGKTTTLTVETDETTLGNALLEKGIISGEPGPYGLYVQVVNGITADYDTDAAFWYAYKNGEALMTGVDSTPIADGEHYEFVYTRS